MTKLTLTGVDETVSTDWIKKMGRDFMGRGGTHALEFAILRSPKAGQSPRYPTRQVIAKITNYVYPHQLAFHLCGRYAELVLSGDWSELCDAVDFSLVRRVQVNSKQDSPEAIIQLQRFSVFIGIPVVMQWRAGNFPYVAGLHLLQDRSGGTGKEESIWFTPDNLCIKGYTYIGYAGGLNPDNIEEKLKQIKDASRGCYFWVDCETGIRTNDFFDTAKAEAMARAVIGAPRSERM